jgi:hypothetical protein
MGRATPSKPLCISLAYIITLTITMGILEKGGLIITCLQNLFCYDLSCKMASRKPFMKFIQNTWGFTLSSGSSQNTIPVATPLWRSCEVATHTPKNGTWESSGTLKNSERDCKGQNTLYWGFFVLLERSWTLDVQNGLVWAIWTSSAQVMVERRAGSQIASLTPNH